MIMPGKVMANIYIIPKYRKIEIYILMRTEDKIFSFLYIVN